MNKSELRVRWEERVSMADKGVLDAIWQDLEDSGDVNFALSEQETGLEDLVLDTENRLKYWRLGRGYKKPVGRSVRTPVDVELEPYEKECAETASLYLAKKAASSPTVRRFRQERLGGKLLTTEEVEEFLREEYLRDVPDDLRSLNEYEQDFIAQLGGMGLDELLEFVVPIDRAPRGLSQDLLFPYEGSDGFIVSRKKITENFTNYLKTLTIGYHRR